MVKQSTSVVFLSFLLVSCAVQTPPSEVREGVSTIQEQRKAQAAASAMPSRPQLKRKIALGRVTNETKYGISLLRNNDEDPLGKQISDMVSKALVESSRFIVLERPDISSLKREAEVSGQRAPTVGADILVLGSLTEFGRKTVGQSGFASNTKKQVAFAKIELRAVDSRTGHVLFAASGAGEASTETSSVFGFGSQAGYDGTLNDAAIRQAVASVVNEIATRFAQRPWESGFLDIQDNRLIIAGGHSQGLRSGMRFGIFERDKVYASPQTGLPIRVPGKKVGTLVIEQTFGASEPEEGSFGQLEGGSLKGYDLNELVVREVL